MAGKIFIDYRRDDDPGSAQALFARLEQAFPPEQLFIDVDSIEPGLDFVRVLNDQVAQCDVLVAVIGRDWIDARDSTGGRRLDNPGDFVRIEIESALAQDKRVIPVLVGQAEMPRPDQLPETLRSFARRNAVRLTHERFRADAQGLITALQRVLKSAEDARMARAATEAEQRAKAERERREVETKRRDEEAGRGTEEARAHERTDKERRRRDAEVEPQGDQARRLRAEIEAKLQAEKHERQRPQPAPSEPVWRALLIGSSAGLVVIGAVVWLVLMRSTPTPGTPTSTPSPAPAPITVSALSPDQERALKPKDTFKECSNCPDMIVVPAGSFTMGSPTSEPGRFASEGPQHKVTIAKQFAIGQFELTFEEWDACVAESGCNGYRPLDQGWGRGHRPVINVSWNDAKAYVAWLAKKTDKFWYRLLTEAEYEYAARAGTTMAYPWGSAIGKNNANCRGCGSQWDNKQTAPVGSFTANGFGLYDMVGNVWAWVEDCYHDSYSGAPADGSAWTDNCEIAPAGVGKRPVARGGSWNDRPWTVRPAARGSNPAGSQNDGAGFRVGRTLLAP